MMASLLENGKQYVLGKGGIRKMKKITLRRNVGIQCLHGVATSFPGCLCEFSVVLRNVTSVVGLGLPVIGL